MRQLFDPLFRLMLIATAAVAVAACSSGGSTSNANQGAPAASNAASQDTDSTYDEETVLSAAEGFFGDSAEGIARALEQVFADQGRPNGYIIGEEAGGGFIGALRYGSGTLHHKIEGTRQVHWTGPSIGFEIGGNAAKVFTLVYNLYDTEDIFRRYPAVEGQFYFVAGLGVNYHQRDDVILAPIRTGIGVRATANVGYLKYTPDRKFNPF